MHLLRPFILFETTLSGTALRRPETCSDIEKSRSVAPACCRRYPLSGTYSPKVTRISVRLLSRRTVSVAVSPAL